MAIPTPRDLGWMDTVLPSMTGAEWFVVDALARGSDGGHSKARSDSSSDGGIPMRGCSIRSAYRHENVGMIQILTAITAAPLTAGFFTGG